jgi:hypothetical protein
VMSSNKAANEEGFQEEFLKHGLRALVSHLVDLFNHVVNTGFPSAWSDHIIHPIHKSSPNTYPNNYRKVGQTFTKLHATVLHMKLSNELEQRSLRARGQEGFQYANQTIDHIFTLQVIIKEARHHSSKVYYCFVDFRKSFDSVSRESFFRRLKDNGISQTLLTTIMCLYELILGCLLIVHRMFNFNRSTIGVKRGCPLSPTLFGIYIDELKAFLHEHIQDSNGCLLHQVLISILLFVDDMVLLASSP